MASEWKTELLGNLCLMKNGYAFKSKDFVNQGIPVIKIKNVKPNRILVDDLSYVPVDVAEQRKKWLIEKGEILLTMTGNRADGSPESWVGKAAIFNENTPYLLNQRVSALKAKDENIIDTNYLGYYLSSWQTQLYFIKRANSSGGQANISPEIVMNMPIHYPPLTTQKKIVSILAALDQKIKINAAINDNLAVQIWMDDTSISPDMSFDRSASLNSANFADSRLFACIARYIGATTDSNSARRSAEGMASSIALSMSVVMLGTAEPAFIDARSLAFTKWNTNFATFGIFISVKNMVSTDQNGSFTYTTLLSVPFLGIRTDSPVYRGRST